MYSPFLTLTFTLMPTFFPDDSVGIDLQTLVTKRSTTEPSHAQYTVAAAPAQAFLGRNTMCRCYTLPDGEFYTEEIAESWQSRIWFFRGHLLWNYVDATGEHTFTAPRQKDITPQQCLKNKEFAICRMERFDTECINIVERSSLTQVRDRLYSGTYGNMDLHVTLLSDRAELRMGSPAECRIKYSYSPTVPPWKRETDTLLTELRSRTKPIRKLEADFTFIDVMELLAEEDSRETVISPSELVDAAVLHGYVLPTVDDAKVVRTSATGRGRMLTLTVELGKRRITCVQYKLDVEWTEDNRIKSSPISPNTIMKTRSLENGELLLLSNGEGVAPSTCFIHNSGQTVYVSENVFMDDAFVRFVNSLRKVGL